MRYLLCQDCGGYYELEKGESPDDFESCLCGGKLEHVDEVPVEKVGGTSKENIKEDLEDNIKEKEIKNEVDNDLGTKLICSNCFKEETRGIFCSNCGGRLITVKEGKITNNLKFKEYSKEFEHIKPLEENSKRPKSLFDRISWIGVLAGVGFFIVASIVSIVLFFIIFLAPYYGSLNSLNSLNYSNMYFYIIFLFLILLLILILILVASGALASIIGKIRNYDDGIFNGFLVGAIISLLSLISGRIESFMIGILIYGALSAFGGAIGVFIRKNMEKKK